MQRRGSSAQGDVSALNRAEGVAEDASPNLRDAASHFVDNRQRAQTDFEVRERRLSEDDQALQGERERRQDGKSLFVDANPGRKPDSEPPLTTQWEFYTGDGGSPKDRR